MARPRGPRAGGPGGGAPSTLGCRGGPNAELVRQLKRMASHAQQHGYRDGGVSRALFFDAVVVGHDHETAAPGERGEDVKLPRA